MLGICSAKMQFFFFCGNLQRACFLFMKRHVTKDHLFVLKIPLQFICYYFTKPIRYISTGKLNTSSIDWIKEDPSREV